MSKDQRLLNQLERELGIEPTPPTLCVCGHPSADHRQYDSGEYCMFDLACLCDRYRKTAPKDRLLSAGVTPEGLAGATVSGYVNPDGSGEGDYVALDPDPEYDRDHPDWQEDNHG